MFGHGSIWLAVLNYASSLSLCYSLTGAELSPTEDASVLEVAPRNVCTQGDCRLYAGG